MKQLKNSSHPEFRNRLDGMVEFVSLEREHIDMIVDKTINEINEMLKEKNVTLSLSSRQELGYVIEDINLIWVQDPLQRVVNDHQKPLSKEILFGKLIDGGQVLINIENDEVRFEYR